jgi:transposase
MTLPSESVSLAEWFNSGKENGNDEVKATHYTIEFKLEAVRMVKSGQSLAVVSKVLGVSDQTLHNWVKLDKNGQLNGPGSKAVSPEQMEVARLRAELARVKMQRDILGKATAYFAKQRE